MVSLYRQISQRVIEFNGFLLNSEQLLFDTSYWDIKIFLIKNIFEARIPFLLIKDLKTS